MLFVCDFMKQDHHRLLKCTQRENAQGRHCYVSVMYIYNAYLNGAPRATSVWESGCRCIMHNSSVSDLTSGVTSFPLIVSFLRDVQPFVQLSVFTPVAHKANMNFHL